MDWHGQVEIDHVWYTPTWGEWILLYIAFCTILTISRQKEARRRDNALLLFLMTSRVLYSAQYHRQHCTLQAFKQFGTLYMHNHDICTTTICTTTMTNIRPNRDSNLVPSGYQPQSIRMSHRGRPHRHESYIQEKWTIEKICKRCSFKGDMWKYGTCSMNMVWAFRLTPYSLNRCCIFLYCTQMNNVCIFSTWSGVSQRPTASSGRKLLTFV